MKFATLVPVLLSLILLLLTTTGYPHERGNGRPRLPSASRDQAPQRQQQQQTQTSAEHFDVETYYNEVWESYKTKDLMLLAYMSHRALQSEFTKEVLIEEFLVSFEEERWYGLKEMIESKFPALRKRYGIVDGESEEIRLGLTANAILLVIGDLYPTSSVTTAQEQ